MPGPVSIVIKALNEEAHIEDCLSSALWALGGIGGEVVLADSCSNDATTTVAMRYPVRIVQLARASERCCGVGAQLGYEHAQGQFICVLDGDMQLDPDFLPAALSLLARQPEIAGVGGQVVECNSAHLEYRARNEKPSAQRRAGPVDRLDGGGLYRRIAIESVGYLSDRNLYSYEEFDLGLRLRLKGWKLWRLPIDSASHQGHTPAPFALLKRRWRSGYAWGVGQLLRACWGQWQRLAAVLGLREVRLYLGLIGLWLAGLLGLSLSPLLGLSPLWVLVTGLLAGLLALLTMAWRKRSIGRAVYALTAWHVNAAGLVRGLLQPRRSTDTPIDSHLIQEPKEPFAQAPAPSGPARTKALHAHTA